MANDKDYAIVIGIEFYKDHLSQLRGPHADSKKFSKWLQDPKGGGIPKSNIKILTSTDTFTPTKDDVDEWLDEKIEMIKNSGNRARRLFLYFSGHGIASSPYNSALLLPKWTYSNRQYGLSSERYLQELTSKGTFSEIYIFMDCCRNRIANVNGAEPYFSGGKPSSNSCESIVLYSSEFDNNSYEATLTNDGETLNDLLPRGLFTEVLTRALYGAAADKNGKLNLDNLIRYMNRALPQLALSTNKKQIPRADNTFVTGSRPLTPSFEAKVPFEITFLKKDSAQMVLEDAELNVVKEGNSKTGKWKVTLSRGYHLLRKKSEDNGVYFYVDGLQNELLYN